MQQLVLCCCGQRVTLALHLKPKAVTEVRTNTIRIFLRHAFVAAQMNRRILLLKEKTKEERNSCQVFQPGHSGGLGIPP